MLTFICYSKCSTCRKARKYLDDNLIPYISRDIAADNPTVAELSEWAERSGLPLRKFFNTSGTRYRELQLSSRIKELSEAQMLELLSSDGMLVKRPMLIGDAFVLVGFSPEAWEKAIIQ